MNGVIWDKMQKTFVPISSVPVYAMMQQERLRQSRELETHNFQLQNLTLTSYNDKGFLEFYDNDTKVTGFCGDVWTILSRVLNFTLQPVKSNTNSLGIPKTKESNITYYYQDGLLGIISRNETDAIPKLEAYTSRLEHVEFTMPLWMSGHRLYIRYDGIYDSTWMTKVFSWEIWCLMFIMYISFSLCSVWSQSLLTRIRYKYKNIIFSEHFFYNYGMFCNQNNMPDILKGRSKILEASLGLFCSVLSMSYGALLFIYMSKRDFTPPFNNVESFIMNTKYNIITLNGTMGDMLFKLVPFGYFAIPKKTGRFVSVSTNDEMRELACSQNKMYAIYQDEEEFKAHEQIKCHLIATGEYSLSIWITSGLARNFKYKRSIDLGILKLMEIGMLNILKKHWLKEYTKDNINIVEPIKIDQVFFMIAVISSGMIAAFVILVIEKIVYAYKLKLHRNLR